MSTNKYCTSLVIGFAAFAFASALLLREILSLSTASNNSDRHFFSHILSCAVLVQLLGSYELKAAKLANASLDVGAVKAAAAEQAQPLFRLGSTLNEKIGTGGSPF